MGKYNKNPPRIVGGSLFGAGSGTRSAILGQYRRQIRGTQKVFTGYFLPFGMFPSSPAYLLSTSKKESVAEHELRIWCSKAIQIRTVFVADSFLQFREGDGFRALLVVEGDHHFIIVQENRVDEGVNEHLAVAFLPHVQLAEAMEPEGHKLGTDLGLRQLFAGKPVLKLVAAVFQFLLRSFWRRIKSSSLSEQALENFRIVW